jgi:hypothetical protein
VNPTRLADKAPYSSPLANWHARASVRRSPRHVLDDGDDAVVYFPPHLEPVVAHPLVVAQGPAARGYILVRRLYQYLTFTVELEATTVVPVTSAIARGRSGLELPAPMRADAFKIATDEAWHAQFSYDLMTQVATATGLTAQPWEEPAFAGRLARLARSVPPELRAAYDLLTAVVSETLISALLAELPHYPLLPDAVRAVVADHAEDEGRHHAYFRALLGYLWPALDRAGQRQLGPLVPELIAAFLEPDHTAVSDSLRGVGLSQDATAQVLAESYPWHVVQKTIANAARPTVRYFTEVGALTDSQTYAAFATAGMCDGA